MNTQKTPRARAGRTTPATESARSPPAAARPASGPAHQGTAAPWQLRQALLGLARRSAVPRPMKPAPEPAARTGTPAEELQAGARAQPQAVRPPEGTAVPEAPTAPRVVSRIPVGARDPMLPEVMPA
jgi:hypothetical protein